MGLHKRQGDCQWHAQGGEPSWAMVSEAEGSQRGQSDGLARALVARVGKNERASLGGGCLVSVVDSDDTGGEWVNPYIEGAHHGLKNRCLLRVGADRSSGD